MGKFVRPMTFASTLYPQFKEDQKLAENIAKFAGQIALGGDNRYSLGVKPNDVFQVASDRLNVHSYVANIDGSKLLRHIVDNTPPKNFEKDIEKIIGAKICDLKIERGLLQLVRKVYQSGKYNPDGSKRKNRALPRTRHDGPFIVEDNYWLDIYETDSILPVLRIYADSIGAVRQPFEPTASNIRNLNQSHPECFQRPDEIVLSWHDLARLGGVDDTWLYGRACLELSAITHPVIGQPNDIPLNTYLPGYSTSTLESLLTTYDGPNSLVPVFARRVSQIEVSRFHDNTDNPLPLTLPWDHLVVLAAFAKREAFTLPLSDFPDGTKVGEAIVDFLLARWGNAPVYLGNGLFSIANKSVLTLAAGNGSWGSGEHGFISALLDDAIKHPGEAGMVGTLIADFGLSVYQDLFVDEKEIRKCYEDNIHHADCQKCVLTSTTADIVALRSGIGLTSGVIAIGLASSPLGWLGALALLGYQIYNTYKNVNAVYDAADNCPHYGRV